MNLEKGVERYGHSMMWLHAKIYAKGGLIILLKHETCVDNHGLLPLTLPLDERVLRVGSPLLSMTSMNVHAPKPAADPKVFREEHVGVE